MRILVTGHRGYIGAHLVELLKDAGHAVTGCDVGLFDGCELEPLVPVDRELRRDVRELDERDLEGHDVVVHLAAISNDPMGELAQELTRSVNAHGSIRLAEVARRAGVPRFLLASSCSIYGRGETPDLDETAALNPVSTYAASKIEAEEGIAGLAGDGFTPVFLRNATAYGDSRMLRIDLVANNFLACLVATGEIRIMSDGEPWRPLIHCRDIARAFVAFAEAPAERVSGRAVNVGADEENYQVKDVAGIAASLVPRARVVFTGEVGHDPRDYRVRFGLLRELLPEFRLEYTLARGMEELHASLVARGFDLADFEGDRFVRLRRLRERLHLLEAVAA